MDLRDNCKRLYKESDGKRFETECGRIYYCNMDFNKELQDYPQEFYYEYCPHCGLKVTG
jgi:hypothetical protein